jgi:hypothetical protein
LKARANAVAVGTVVSGSIVSTRVFANGHDGFALASKNNAQYPARTVDGGQTWRINGPQFHINAADAPEAVQFVGLLNSRKYFAYGSSVVDVTTNAGRTWFETYMGDAVLAVVPGFIGRGSLLAYVQDLTGSNSNKVSTLQYVSRDGGRHWHYTTAFGG